MWALAITTDRVMYPVVAKKNADGETLTGIASVSAGYRANYALTNDENANVYAWGYNESGKLGLGTRGGNTMYPTLVKKNNTGIDSLSDIMMVESGGESRHVIAAAKSGGVYTWGANGYGQLGDQTHTESAYPVVVGSSPVSIDTQRIRINLKDSGDHTVNVTASTTSQPFSLFDTDLESASRRYNLHHSCRRGT